MRSNVEDHFSGGGKRADGERVKGIPVASAGVEFEEDVLACFPGHLGRNCDADGSIWEEEKLGFGIETVECGAEERECEGGGVNEEGCDRVVPATAF
jgi:hypothetical protein